MKILGKSEELFHAGKAFNETQKQHKHCRYLGMNMNPTGAKETRQTTIIFGVT